ncbi:MAG: flagellar basal body-associated FliL family protein [Alphaproteobacteria bacterium]|nr:flagellar basal body-associated FliL family protein [Alphaproteobacteria bacterium]
MKHILKFLVAVALLMSALPYHEARANSAPAEEGEGEGGPEISLVPLIPLLIPILRGSRVTKYVILKLSLETAPEADVEAVIHDLPRVNDALLRESYLFAKENSGADDVDMEALRARLLAVINSILGDGKIAELYFTGTDTLRA